jgi:RimJ/RimL family protein N-acetyltransferase
MTALLIETPRLRQRPVGLDDERFVVPLHTDARVMSLLRDGVQTPDQALAELAAYATPWRDHGVGIWLMFDRADGAFLGECGVIDRRAEHEAFAIRLALHHAYWSQGYMGEALRPVVDDLFERAGLDIVRAIAKRMNVASGRTLLRAGFAVERSWEKNGLTIERFIITRATWRARAA